MQPIQPTSELDHRETGHASKAGKYHISLTEKPATQMCYQDEVTGQDEIYFILHSCSFSS